MPWGLERGPLAAKQSDRILDSLGPLVPLLSSGPLVLAVGP